MTNNISRFSTAPSTSDMEEPAYKSVEEQKPPELVYGSAEEFLHEPLLPPHVRDVDDRAAKWCLEWFSTLKRFRVEDLWRAWENHRLNEAMGISVWWKDHADHHMSVLVGLRGRFYKGDMQKHRDPKYLSQSVPRRNCKDNGSGALSVVVGWASVS